MKQLFNKLFTALLVLILSPVAVLIVILAKLAFRQKRKMIYISGKITGLLIFEYENEFARAATLLRRKYPKAIIVSPLNIRPLFGIRKWMFYMAADLHYLLKCDSIAFMQNWKDSRGARIEMIVALLFNKEIIMLYY